VGKPLKDTFTVALGMHVLKGHAAIQTYMADKWGVGPTEYETLAKVLPLRQNPFNRRVTGIASELDETYLRILKRRST